MNSQLSSLECLEFILGGYTYLSELKGPQVHQYYAWFTKSCQRSKTRPRKSHYTYNLWGIRTLQTGLRHLNLGQLPLFIGWLPWNILQEVSTEHSVPGIKIACVYSADNFPAFSLLLHCNLLQSCNVNSTWILVSWHDELSAQTFGWHVDWLQFQYLQSNRTCAKLPTTWFTRLVWAKLPMWGWRGMFNTLHHHRRCLILNVCKYLENSNARPTLHSWVWLWNL